ncbi:charged multivesicular body protein 3 [Drosophila innubila]|uniref:charged multivesicular body protein 3 n=1 Tax=Drosophila innubila TaxID=198719 RepID=UPI00148C0973|nr:charged multivesicular body protein 3 [Drosophila innubila]XP_034488575.1 charged multivesicular body protein 3 [Drosophila innubila]
MGLFGKTPSKDPKEQVQEWTHKLRKEGNQLDRQIRSIQREEDKVKRSLKQAAQKNDRDTCIILAKEIVNARKAINRIYTSKAHLSSIQMQMKNQLSTLRVAGSLQKSTEVMQAMQSLVRYPELAGIMRDMSKEMMKAGIIEEMLDETMDSLEESEELEEQAAKEVDKVLWEITDGKLGEAPLPPEATPADRAPAAAATASASRVPVEVEDDDDEGDELQEMQSRLASLRS